MKQLTYVLTVAVLTAFVPFISGDDQKPNQPTAKPDPKKVQELMHKKLENSQKLLEALTLNDLDKAGRHAQELMRIRREASWMIVKSDMYETWSNDFAGSADNIVQAAKDKNLEGAKLNYLSLTLACFHCHTYVRDLRRTALEESTDR